MRYSARSAVRRFGYLSKKLFAEIFWKIMASRLMLKPFVLFFVRGITLIARRLIAISERYQQLFREQDEKIIERPLPATPTLPYDSDSAKVIYDVGSYNCDDIEYYLKKGHKVISIEANPELVGEIRECYSSELKTNRLVVVNCAVGENSGESFFYINQRDRGSSTLDPTAVGKSGPWAKIRVPVERLSNLIIQYGNPYYIKIDVEGVDLIVLKDLYRAGIHSPYLSTEAHSILPFAALLMMGYDRFKLIEGREIVRGKFNSHEFIDVYNTLTTHSFSRHSSGPFGDDIPGSWLGIEEFLNLFHAVGPGWKDIHATSDHWM